MLFYLFGFQRYTIVLTADRMSLGFALGPTRRYFHSKGNTQEYELYNEMPWSHNYIIFIMGIFVLVIWYIHRCHLTSRGIPIINIPYIKMSSYQYRTSHYKDRTVAPLSDIDNGNAYNCKMVLILNGPQISCCPEIMYCLPMPSPVWYDMAFWPLLPEWLWP